MKHGPQVISGGPSTHIKPSAGSGIHTRKEPGGCEFCSSGRVSCKRMEQAGRALLVQSMKSIVRDPRRVQAFFLAVQLRLFPPPRWRRLGPFTLIKRSLAQSLGRLFVREFAFSLFS